MRAGQEKNIEGGGDASPWTGAQTMPSTLVRTLGTKGGLYKKDPGGSRDGEAVRHIQGCEAKAPTISVHACNLGFRSKP